MIDNNNKYVKLQVCFI